MVFRAFNKTVEVMNVLRVTVKLSAGVMDLGYGLNSTSAKILNWKR